MRAPPIPIRCRKSPMTKGPFPTTILLATRFKQFHKEMRDIWESYQLVTLYMPTLHNLVRDGKVAPLHYLPLHSAKEKSYSRDSTLGAISHLTRKANPRRCLVDAVGAFENYIVDLVEYVYRDHPAKLLSGQGSGTPEQDLRVLQVVVGSATRDEILSKLAEERIRSVFYGKPTEVFTKDRAKLEFGNYFSSNFSEELGRFNELTGRRNLLVHRGGRVDRKYLRENPGSEFSLGQSVSLSPEYLRDSIVLLDGLAAAATTKVFEAIYHDQPRRGGVLADCLDYFLRKRTIGQAPNHGPAADR